MGPPATLLEDDDGIERRSPVTRPPAASRFAVVTLTVAVLATVVMVAAHPATEPEPLSPTTVPVPPAVGGPD